MSPGPALAATVLTGGERGSVTPRAGARELGTVGHAGPNATTATDLDQLRAAGFDDAQIIAITLFISLRIAFATVNDALGSQPDRELAASVPTSYAMP